jgi:HK97 family phage prohead protease
MQKGLVQNVPDQIMIKDIDKTQGRIIGYFSVFGNIDSDGDMIMPGSFKRTIQNNGHRIKHLWQHDSTKPLAAPQVSEDSYGLVFDSTISKTSYGRDVLQLYIDGVVNEHSIGYQVLRSEKRAGYTELQELKLWEGSTVTFAANEMALVTDIKRLNPYQLTSKMDAIEKALDRGRYENEEVFESLEMCYKSMKQHAARLGIVQPRQDFTPSETKAILDAIDKANKDMDDWLCEFKLRIKLGL